MEGGHHGFVSDRVQRPVPDADPVDRGGSVQGPVLVVVFFAGSGFVPAPGVRDVRDRGAEVFRADLGSELDQMRLAGFDRLVADLTFQRADQLRMRR